MQVLLILVALYLLLYFSVPKGWLLHEGLHLPFFWLQHLFRRRVPMEEVKISYGPHRHQYFLHFKPTKEITKKEIVVYFHGGSWRYGRPRFFRLNASFFASRGYQVILPSHRHPPRNKFPELREDLNLLLQKITEVATDQELFNFKLIVSGMSSGAHLATILTFDRSALQSIGFPASRISGLFINGAPLNLNLLPDHSVIRDMAGPRSGELFQIANPMNYLNPEVKTPILCFHGTKDGMVPLVSIQAFVKELQAYHPSFTYHPVNSGNHVQALRWLYKNGEERKVLDDWLEKISNSNL